MSSTAPRRVTLLKKAYASISGNRRANVSANVVPSLATGVLCLRCASDATAVPLKPTSLVSLSLAPTDDEDINRMGEKVMLREQVKELFNRKYGGSQVSD